MSNEFEDDDDNLEMPESWKTAHESTYQSSMNAVCQKLDRILSGDSELTVESAEFKLAPAYTNLRDRRSQVYIDHDQTAKWSLVGSNTQRDRIGLTLALNLHELGHVRYSPRLNKARDSAVYQRTDAEYEVFNVIEDSRQEMLMTLEYGKAVDHFRLVNARVLKETLKDYGHIPAPLLILYYGRRHLFPSDVNMAIEAAFAKQHGQANMDMVKDLINEFLTLELPAHMARAWIIVNKLVPYWHGPKMPMFNEECMPQNGQPSVSKGTQRELSQRVRAVLKKRGDKVPEEDGQGQGEGQANETDETDEQGQGTGEGEGDEEGDEGEGQGQGDESDEPASEAASAGTGHGTSQVDTRAVETPTATPRTPVPQDEIIRELGEAELGAASNLDSEIRQSEDNLGGRQEIALPASMQVTATDLSRLFAEIATDLMEQKQANQRSGKLDLHGLTGKILANSDRMFSRTQDDLTRDAAMAIHIAVDLSGSMGASTDMHSNLRKALNAGMTISRGAEMAGHMARITGFSDTHETIKGWDEADTAMRVSGGGGTDPLALFREIPVDFAALQEKREIHNHVLIVITDGQFTNSDECQAEFTNMRHEGTYVIMIGIGQAATKWGSATGGGRYTDLYADLVISDAGDLASVMRETLRRLASQISLDVRMKGW